MVRSLLGYIYKKLYNAEQRDGVNFNWDCSFEHMIKGISLKKNAIQSSIPKSLAALKVLGIASDYDILIDFSGAKHQREGVFEREEHVLDQVRDFINSSEKFLGLREDTSELKRAIIPIGDVKSYAKQLEGEKSAVSQGGVSLDWLAFPLDGKGGFVCQQGVQLLWTLF